MHFNNFFEIFRPRPEKLLLEARENFCQKPFSDLIWGSQILSVFYKILQPNKLFLSP